LTSTILGPNAKNEQPDLAILFALEPKYLNHQKEICQIFSKFYTKKTIILSFINSTNVNEKTPLNTLINDEILELSKQSKYLLFCDHVPDLNEWKLKTWLQKDKIPSNKVFFSTSKSKSSTQCNLLFAATDTWKKIGGFSPYHFLPQTTYQDFLSRAKLLEIFVIEKEIKGSNKQQSAYFEKPYSSLISKEIEFKFYNSPHYQNHLIKKKPDFVVIGAQKCGSSSIITHLQQHPEVFVPMIKENDNILRREINFFNSKKYEDRGMNWYTSLFYHPHKKYACEKSNKYFHLNSSHEKLHRELPNAKLILTLREPVKRAYSALQHSRRQKKAWGASKLQDHSSKQAFDLLSKDFLDTTFIKFGMYINQLENLLKYYPRNQIKILIIDQFKTQHDKIYKDLYDFLGIDSSVKAPHEIENVGNYKDERSQESINRLKGFYQPYNERLFKLLGYRIPEWD